MPLRMRHLTGYTSNPMAKMRILQHFQRMGWLGWAGLAEKWLGWLGWLAGLAGWLGWLGCMAGWLAGRLAAQTCAYHAKNSSRFGRVTTSNPMEMRILRHFSTKKDAKSARKRQGRRLRRSTFIENYSCFESFGLRLRAWNLRKAFSESWKNKGENKLNFARRVGHSYRILNRSTPQKNEENDKHRKIE